jgi:hypothetical protein
MTKQATISPIDPSLSHALAPQIQGAPVGARAQVSVEAINGYLSLAQDTLGEDKAALGNILLDLGRQVHPLVLGETYRRRQQTQSMAERLLAPHLKNAENRKKIISFLSSDSGSHDYTLNRREATALGLKVVKCPARLYPVLRSLYHDFRDEMQLRTPFNASQFPANAVTPFKNLRATIESSAARAVQYVTEGNFGRQPAAPPNVGEVINVEVTSEGWRTI